MALQERVDIVDQNDRVVQVVTRARMRAERLRHRATYIFLFRGDGRLFVHQRTAGKDIYPGRFDVAIGGVCASGESYDDGARAQRQPFCPDSLAAWEQMVATCSEGPWRSGA